MLHTKYFYAFALIISLSGFAVFAQTATDSPTASKEEKEKAKLELEKKAFALAERSASEALNLRLAENRAFVLASAGDLLWKQDQKRARSLFRSAADELVTANAEAEARQANDDDMYAGFAARSSPRSAILQKVAKHDPDLALELLLLTRPPKLAAAIAKANAPENPNEKEEPAPVGYFNSPKFMIQEEMRLEQSFAAQAVEKDPKRAAKLLRESLSKNGVTYEAMNTIRKIHAKDAELANQLLAELAQKVMSGDFSKPDSTDRQAASQLLYQFGRKSTAVKEADSKKVPLKLEDKVLRDLAGKVVDSLLKAEASAYNSNPFYELNNLTPILEKILPERAPALKNKLAEVKKSTPAEAQMFSSFGSMNDPDATPDNLIADAAKVPQGMGWMRGQLYRRASDKLIEKGDYDRARQLLNTAPAGKERDEAIAQVDSKQAEQAAKDGKFDEARKLISKIGTKSNQVQQLVGLALAFHAKGDKESKETAAKIMDEAKAMIETSPQSDAEITDLVQVVAGYAVVEPAEAFTLVSPLVDQANDLIQASALLAKYQKRQFMFRDGEMLMMAGMGQMRGNMRFIKDLGILAAADFERTRGLADRFQRSDVRVLVQLLIAQSVLNEGVDAGSFGMGGFTFISNE